MKKSRAVAVSLVALLAVTVGCEQQRAIHPRTVRTEDTNDALRGTTRIPTGGSHVGYSNGTTSGIGGNTSSGSTSGSSTSTASSTTSRGGFGWFGGTSSSAS